MGDGGFADQQRAFESLDIHWGYSGVPVIENTVIERHFFIVVVLRLTKKNPCRAEYCSEVLSQQQQQLEFYLVPCRFELNACENSKLPF